MEGDQENCYQWKATGQCSGGVCCSFRHASNRGQEAQSSSLAPKAQTQTDGRKPSKVFGFREKVLLDRNVRWCATATLKELVRIRRVIFGILPYVTRTKLNRDSVYSDTLSLMGSPVKSRRKVVEKDHLPSWRSPNNWVACPKTLYFRKNLFHRKAEKRNQRRRHFLQGHVAPHTFQERVHRKELYKCEPQERNPCAAILEDRTLQKKPSNKNDAPAEKHGTWRKTSTSTTQWTRPRSTLSYRHTGNSRNLFEKANGTRIRVRFRNIDAHAEQEDLNSAELETLRESSNPTPVITPNREVQSS